MKTPIVDFVRKYQADAPLRLHMPGHKGSPAMGFESADITEIEGADSLYHAEGIIRESEKNAGTLFGAHSFYSTEGSSLSIRAMLYLAVLYAGEKRQKPCILAGRNCHQAFLSSAILLDFEIDWLYPKERDGYLSCTVTKEDVEKRFCEREDLPTALYITSPDYLGNMQDIAALAEVCHRYGVLLLVDNAHGAYLQFLEPSRHPIALGADVCCDSAHKTLPALTGGAYLHVSKTAPSVFRTEAKCAMALFGSTSPSYLILASLDMLNGYLAEGYREKLASFCQKTALLFKRLHAKGFCLVGDEPLKLTLLTKPYGYTGKEVATYLREKDIVAEFADQDNVVLMLTPEVGETGLVRLENALTELPKKAPKQATAPAFSAPAVRMSVRAAALAPREKLSLDASVGKVMAVGFGGCPPAVIPIVGGEEISPEAVSCLAYYGITECAVVKE